eukprot:1340817-Pleurochrysis_carterae.AAC.1
MMRSLRAPSSSSASPLCDSTAEPSLRAHSRRQSEDEITQTSGDAFTQTSGDAQSGPARRARHLSAEQATEIIGAGNRLQARAALVLRKVRLQSQMWRDLPCDLNTCPVMRSDIQN